METVVKPPADAELHLLTDWGDPNARSRTRKAVMGTIFVHVGAVLFLAFVPESWLTGPARPLAEFRQQITPLIEPLTELTQKAPNKGKVNKEFDAREIEPKPRIQLPAGAPSTTRPRALQQAAVPSIPIPKPAPPPPLPEAPKVEAQVKQPALPQIVAPPPPQIQAAEQPKMRLENVGSAPTVTPGQGQVPLPDTSVAGALHQMVRGNAGGGVVVGDLDVGGPGGVGPGVNMAPSRGSQGSNLELLSDPKGVDFRPYLIRILAAVRRNWLSVVPEAVKLGRRGRVGIQFSIARDGSVPKLVIAAHSGADALDRAAVAGISMSNPFPPLPAEFKGDRIVVQFNFAYNMPKQ
jgi:TonB family protein